MVLAGSEEYNFGLWIIPTFFAGVEGVIIERHQLYFVSIDYYNTWAMEYDVFFL